MIKVQSSVDINPDAWQALLDRAPTASFFQSSACYHFYITLRFIEPFVFAVSEDDQLVGLACGYLIADGGAVKRYFSRRAIIPGGLLLDENISDEAIYALLKAVQRVLSDKGALYIELRNYNDFSPFRTAIVHSGFNYQLHLNIHVPTPDVATAFSQLSDSKQRQVKQTLKAGASCDLSDDKGDLKAFYQLLTKLYRRKVKKPLFPYEFFDKLLLQPFTRFFVVKKADKVLGGIFCVQSDKVVYEWFICGENIKSKKVYPSVLATWKAIEYAAENGFEYFDFMGAGKKEEPYGVREFKSKFGGELVEQGRFLYICKPGLYKFSKSVLNVMKIILPK
jgi:lipid II:glycine glycyltransferase (peptidoglycan interpeptide bridge formation enzyme)